MLCLLSILNHCLGNNCLLRNNRLELLAVFRYVTCLLLLECFLLISRDNLLSLLHMNSLQNRHHCLNRISFEMLDMFELYFELKLSTLIMILWYLSHLSLEEVKIEVFVLVFAEDLEELTQFEWFSQYFLWFSSWWSRWQPEQLQIYWLL